MEMVQKRHVMSDIMFSKNPDLSTLYPDILEYIFRGPQTPVHYKCIDEYNERNGENVILCSFAYPGDVVKYLKFKRSVDVEFASMKKLKINIPQNIVVDLIKSKRMELVIKSNSFVMEKEYGICRQEQTVDFDVVNAIILMKSCDFARLREYFRPNAEVVSLTCHDNVFIPDYMKEYLVKNKHFDKFINRVDTGMKNIYATKGMNDYVFVSNKESIFMFDRSSMRITEKLPGGKIKYLVNDDKLEIENPLVSIERELDEEWFCVTPKPNFKKDIIDIFIINNALVFFLYFELLY